MFFPLWKGGDIMDSKTPLVDFSGVDFTVVSSGISSAIPTALPVVLTIVGIRKCVSVVMGLIRGA